MAGYFSKTNVSLSARRKKTVQIKHSIWQNNFQNSFFQMKYIILEAKTFYMGPIRWQIEQLSPFRAAGRSKTRI